jgi:MarR family transcriptional regulator, organic hydroperoxide resistance regulator
MYAMNKAPMNTWLGLLECYEQGSSQLAKALEPLEITLAQYDVLIALGGGDGISQQTLAARLVISKANLSSILNRLEERALIERVNDQSDARAKLVHLSPSGQSLIKRALTTTRKLIAATFGQLSQEDLDQLNVIMGRLRVHMDAAKDIKSSKDV